MQVRFQDAFQRNVNIIRKIKLLANNSEKIKFDLTSVNQSQCKKTLPFVICKATRTNGQTVASHVDNPALVFLSTFHHSGIVAASVCTVQHIKGINFHLKKKETLKEQKQLLFVHKQQAWRFNTATQEKPGDQTNGLRTSEICVHGSVMRKWLLKHL